MASLTTPPLTPTDWVLRALTEYPQPLSVSEIAEAIKRLGGPTFVPDQIKYRARQVRDRIVITGSKRGTKYQLRTPDTLAFTYRAAPVAPRRVSEASPPRILRAPEAIALAARVTGHRSTRQPVGYNRAWLEAYVPGETWYLPEATRTHLHELGAPLHADRPAGSVTRNILERLLIDLSWASSRLEGNTYSRLDTQNLIEFGQVAEGKDAYETRMILNHKAAIELLVSEDPRVGVNAYTVRSLHETLAHQLLPDARNEGRLRRAEVRIGGSVYWPTAVPQVIEECFERIVRTAQAIPDPFEASFFLLVHLPYLQPFIDVNKRTSRLAANLPLVAANCLPLSFVDVPEDEYVQGHLAVYELNRPDILHDVYVWAYERSCRDYRVLHDALPPVDMMSLRYRRQIGQAIAAVVRAGAAPARAPLAAEGRRLGVAATDLEAFTESAFSRLLNLHDISAAAAGLTEQEFLAWRGQFSAP